MTHTPGPWKILSGTYNDKAEIKVISENKETAFYALIGYRNREITAQYDANLIAAAPELLKSCKEVLEWLDGQDYFGAQDRLQSLCYDAIAKAEGRECSV